MEHVEQMGLNRSPNVIPVAEKIEDAHLNDEEIESPNKNTIGDFKTK